MIQINDRIESDLKLNAKLHGIEYKARVEAPKVDVKQRDLIKKAFEARKLKDGK